MDFSFQFKQTNFPSLGSDACILGIDEAGRGPVLGPMVYAAFFCRSADEQKLKDLKINDSKKIKESDRERMFESLQANTKDFGWVVLPLSSRDISRQMLRKEKVTLNAIAQTATEDMIDSALRNGAKLEGVFIDTVGNAEHYRAKLSRRFPHLDIVVAEKADSTYPVVGAASILAKVSRDKILQTSIVPPSLFNFGRLGSDEEGSQKEKNAEKKNNIEAGEEKKNKVGVRVGHAEVQGGAKAEKQQNQTAGEKEKENEGANKSSETTQSGLGGGFGSMWNGMEDEEEWKDDEEEGEDERNPIEIDGAPDSLSAPAEKETEETRQTEATAEPKEEGGDSDSSTTTKRKAAAFAEAEGDSGDSQTEAAQTEAVEKKEGSRGSGYPGDPATKEWLQRHLHRVFGWPSLVRFSWSTAVDLLDTKGVAVEWHDEVEEGQQMRVTDWLKSAKDKEVGRAPVPALLKKRKLSSLTEW
uniref:Ribonuclease n=1 Tax=Chromera velia CCMP2878 TaxID=1169474 RepID=A0A0G4HZ33_9ALVE|eukprot:Cvel_9617.t1-p1 / transcript=Cvel_9617.t1 / gene=Cvel_9617 / organism=Chromera_velia_CCMP2878 / gene_product=Ribonuclease H2 subunit A, putative / transcript_product=Ribonuclease H2 subunit A, putative / location=Cvel_scaffold559:2589-7841(+) / protein_length=469 / sequence_SO=supercontig / SO=protein_coding / is_pseudo=false